MSLLESATTPAKGRQYRWTIGAFILVGNLISGLAIWQLNETSPKRWCQIAKEASETNITGCYNLLLKLLDIKDHALIALLLILGLTIISVVVVALGVRISAEGPGGVDLNVGADNTTIGVGDTKVTIPTPPSATATSEGNEK